MKTPDVSRRQILTAGPAAALGLAAGAALAPTIAQADAACGGLSRAEFMRYLQLFNANDPGFIKFYHDDVVLEPGATSIERGPASCQWRSTWERAPKSSARSPRWSSAAF